MAVVIEGEESVEGCAVAGKVCNANCTMRSPAFYRRRAARRKFLKPARDSLASRNSTGKPGSRRYRRYLNRIFAHNTLFASSNCPTRCLLDEYDMEVDDHMFVMEWSADFQRVGYEFFEDQGEDSEDEHYVSASEEYEDNEDEEGSGTDWAWKESDFDSNRIIELLDRIVRQSDIATPAWRMYRRIGRRERQQLLRAGVDRCLRELESLLLSFRVGATASSIERLSAAFRCCTLQKLCKNSLTLHVPQRRERLMLHCLAAYYGLHSGSVNTQTGLRVTTVSRLEGERVPDYPGNNYRLRSSVSTLSSHLRSIRA